MPLIIVTGLPSSGKSTTSKEILNYFQERLKRDNPTRLVRIVSDSEKLDWDGRDSIYMDASREKELRAWLKAEAQRYLNLDQIVILDSAAYIRGFRYELFCTAREARTTYYVVEKFIDPETCWKLNYDRKPVRDPIKCYEDPKDPEGDYQRETFDALVMRYEECYDGNRWDSPLFKLTSMTDQLDLNKLYKRITEGEPLVSNFATTLVSSTASKYKTITVKEFNGQKE